MRLTIRASVAVAVLFIVAGSVASRIEAAGSDVKQALFSAPITIGADGAAVVGEISGPHGELAQAVKAQLALVKFIAAKRDGVAVAADSLVSGVVILTPVNQDEFAISLRQVTLNPRPENLRPPRYPIEQIRSGVSGYAELVLRISPEGRVVDTRTVSSSHADFERVVKGIAKTWKFQPRSTEVEVVAPVYFYMISSRTKHKKPDFQCSVDEARPRVDGDTGCLDLIEVTGLVVQR